MSPATVNVVTRVAPSPAPMLIDSTSGLNLREFVADEDAAHFSSAVLKTIADQKAFVLAQREALEAFNVAKAIRLSEETAAVESKRRIEAAATTSASTAVVISDRAAAAVTQVSSAGPNSATASQPIAIRGDARQSASSDEAAAISLARSWQVDALQPALLEAPKQSMSSSSSPPSTQKKWSTASEASQQYHHHQNHHQYDSRSSSSATAIAKQPSQNLSLSTSPSSYRLSDSRIASSSVSRASSHSTNAIPVSSTSSHHQHQHHRIEQRSLSKREPEPSSISMPTSISHSTSTSTSTTRNHSSDVTNTKRRRTEQLQPSKSSSPPRNTTNGGLVAPPISDSKKSTASARDVRLGQIMSPILENPSEPAPPKSRPMEHRLHSRSRSVRQSSDSDLFTASRNCVKCGNLVASPRTKPSFEHDPFALPFSSVLHVVCTACGTTHCRGCFAVVRCPRDCTGGAQDCTVRNCCPDIRAIAIFEALSSFDHIYATEAGFAGKGQDGEQQQQQMRQAYIKLLMSKADKSMRKFEDAFVRTLRILTTWLEAPRKGSGGGDSDSHAQGMHRAVSHLFAASYLPEVVHAFLSNSNVRDWIAHSETYNAVLETLRRMFDRGLTAVLMRPLRHIARSCGLQGLVWDGGMITWEVDARNRPVESLSLCDLVKQLEKHRLPLMALAEKVQFSATVEKVNNLCDNISYLLLQQLAI